MKVSRTSRLNGEYQKEISVILRKVKDRNVDLKGLISVTEVDVAPDLKTAYVYVSIYGANEAESKRSFEILQESAGFIRRELAMTLNLRITPELTFIEDGSIEYGAKISKILEGITFTDDEEATEGEEQ